MVHSQDVNTFSMEKKIMTTNFSNKKQIISSLKEQLSSRPSRAILALQRLYEFQTEDEKSESKTKHHNLRGFDSVDCKIMTSFAKQLNENGSLSEKQMQILFTRIPKYAGQLIDHSIKSGLIRKEGKVYVW